MFIISVSFYKDMYAERSGGNSMIYLDYAATTPMSDEAIDIYTTVAKSYYGNPISLHDIGSIATNILEGCREQLAMLMNGEKEGFYFTSGGSESNILALQSLIDGNKHRGNHLITTMTEHASVYNFFKKKESEGYDVTYLPVDTNGNIELASLKEAVKRPTILASIHYGNGELGTIQSMKEIIKIVHGADVLLHSDCAQTFGKVEIDLKELPIDSISISSPKLYGPKGVGAVYINPQIRWQEQLPDTTHEFGFKPGTVNVPGVAAFIASAKIVCSGMEAEMMRLNLLRTKLISLLPAGIIVEGDQTAYLSHILALRVEGMEGQYMMLECNRNGIAISTGSACLVGQSEPPRVMKALGRSDQEAKQYIRLSFGKFTTEADILTTADVFESILAKYALGKGVHL